MTAYKYQTKKGTRWEYLTNYVDYDGKKRQKHQQGFKTKKEALEAERVFLTTKRFDTNTPLRAMIDLYRKRIKKASSLYAFNYLLNTVEPLLDTPIADLTEERISDFIHSLDVRPGTQKSYARLFCTFVNYSAKICNIPQKVSVSVSVPRREYQIYTLEEYLEFSSHLERVPKLFFDLLFFTGMRKGEVLALTKEDVSDTISVTKTKDIKGNITPPKTVSSNRRIALPAFLKEELDEYMTDLNGDELFPVSINYFYHHQKKAEQLSGLHHIRIHDFRHSHASFLIANNVNVADISRRLGHADIGTTLSVYSHLYKNNESTIANLIEKSVRNP